MRKIWCQCIKELIQFKRDRLTMALSILLPFATLMIFGFAIRLESKNIPISVQNFDNGLLSRNYIDRLYMNNQFLPSSRSYQDIVKTTLDTGRSKAAVIIPPEFSRHIKSGVISHVQAMIDATDVNNARVIKNSIIATTNNFLQTENLLPRDPLIKPEIRLWFNPGRKESLYVVPGVFGLVLWIYPSLLAALATVREKEQGTILQIYASSIKAFELILGKAIAYSLVGLGITIVIVGAGSVIFRLWFVGDPTPFLIGTCLFIFASVMFGIVIGAASNTQSAAVQNVATAGFTVSLLLSGFLYPVRNITYPLSLISYVVPARYYIELARDSFVRGATWASDWHGPAFLLAFSILLLLMCTKRLSKMQITS